MSHVELFENLLRKRVQLIKPGLLRMQAAYDLLARPGAATPTILVGGTNGKGTTAGLLFAILRDARRVGLYSSPHLVSFCERFVSSAGNLDEARLVRVFEDINQRIPSSLYEELSFFEVITLMALELFAAESTECNILEVGMGGRWDATNITDPLASVIVSIGYDHQAFLGNTLTAIAGEKLGIVRRGRPLFTGRLDNLLASGEGQALMAAKVREYNVPWWRLGDHFTRTDLCVEIALPGTRRVCMAIPPMLAHAPLYLLDNFSIACAVYHWLSEQGQPRSQQKSLPPLERVVDGLVAFPPPAAPTLVGRFTRVTALVAGQKRRLLFDVCHNVDGVKALREALEHQLAPCAVRRLPGLVSILSDKEINPMLDILKGILAPLVVFKIDHDRSMDEEDLQPGHGDVPFFASFAAATSHLAQKAKGEEPWVICGSVLAIGKVLEEIDLKLDGLAIDRILGGDWHFPL